MKLNKYFMLGLAGLAFAACNNDNDVALTDDGNNKTMIVSIAGIGSSSMTRSEKWTEDAEGTGKNNIASLTLLFTDANGVVKYSYATNKTDGGTTWDALFSTQGVKFIGLSDVTAVHAVANTTVSLATGANISTLNTSLADQAENINKATDVIYVGSDKTITPFYSEPANEGAKVTLPGAGEEGNFYYTAEINLVPVISRIQITSIRVKSAGSVNFPEAADGNITANKFKLSWEDFKPTLLGIYLNRYVSQIYDFEGATNAVVNDNESYTDNIASGSWFANASYNNYANDQYTQLIGYKNAADETEEGYSTFDFGTEACYAFNFFVPFDSETGETAASVENPKIHFQFAATVDGYNKTMTLADGSAITDQADLTYINTASTNIQYTLPVTSGYLFANASKLYKEGTTTEVELKPGKIYNMTVEINPINMTIDLNNPQSFNVVVMITVEDFTEENIIAGFE